ncbi:MAG: alanine dehydrogenase [Bacteroidales bacterium]|nr:alanine dehydrogenase [Bacteroidales bacterium]
MPTHDRPHSLLSDFSLMPQEEMLEVENKAQKFSLGIICDDSELESRIPLAPLAVEQLVNNGFEVFIGEGAGKNANFSDLAYSNKGANIISDKSMILNCDVVMKVASLSIEECNMLRGNQLVLTSLHSVNQSDEYFLTLLKKKTTAIAFENIQDNYSRHPIVRSMSEIAGRSSILIASEYLSNANKGKGEMLGGITGVLPSEVVILGAGTAGTYAAITAMGLGARVTVFDHSVYRLDRMQQQLGRQVHTSTIQPSVLENALVKADVLIGAMRPQNDHNSMLVTEEMVMKMKKNSIIVDISIDQGGCIETSKVTSHKKPIFIKHGVIHYCVPNIASRVARTASYALSNLLVPKLIEFQQAGSINRFLKQRQGMRNGVYIFSGILTNELIGRRLGMFSRDIDLLLAAL